MGASRIRVHSFALHNYQLAVDRIASCLELRLAPETLPTPFRPN
jgi:hypothetical protein